MIGDLWARAENGSGWFRRLEASKPGLIVALTIAMAATFLAEHYDAPVMLFALLLGLAFGFLAEDQIIAPGLGFANGTVLRTGVALLGAQVTVTEIAGLGWEVAGAVMMLVIFTIAFGVLLAKLSGRTTRIGILTGGSVAICGASAAMALSAILPGSRTSERDTICVVVAVTTLSTVAMVLYPILCSVLGFDVNASGFLLGATIHDVAQVTGAGYSISETAGETATIVKLMRVAMLPVVLMVCVAAIGRSSGKRQEGFPIFLLGFLCFVALNSLGALPALVQEWLGHASRWMLVTAIAAIGVKTNLAAIFSVGRGLILLVLVETVFLLAAATALVASGLVSV